MKIEAVIAVALGGAITTPMTVAQSNATELVPVPGARVRADRWVILASPIPTRHGTESIAVGRQAGAFRSLRVEAIAGEVQLRSIRIEYSNGRMATFYVARVLGRDQRYAYIDLTAPRFIDNIVVTTAKRPVGSYAVFGAQGLRPGGDLIAARFQ